MSKNLNPSQLDAPQIQKRTFDDPNDAVRIRAIAGGLITDPFDEIVLTYVPSGNGTGEIATATYKLLGSTVNTLTLSYDSSNRLIDVLKT